jgi:hypothetical protein
MTEAPGRYTDPTAYARIATGMACVERNTRVATELAVASEPDRSQRCRYASGVRHRPSVPSRISAGGSAVAQTRNGLGVGAATVSYLGWFGPRGLATIVFAVEVVEEAEVPGVDTITGVAIITVALSVLGARADGVSGITVVRGVVRRPRRQRRRGGQAPEPPLPSLPWGICAVAGSADGLQPVAHDHRRHSGAGRWC